MKSIFFRMMAVILLFIGLVYLTGSLLPRDYSVHSTIEVNAPADLIFPMVNELANWKKWSPWSDQSGIDVKLVGEPAGVGSIQTWSDPRGDGKLWITESEANKRVTYKMYSGGFPEMQSTIEIETTDSGAIVNWSSDGTLPSGPFYGFFGLLFEPGMLAEYDRGLAKLKSIVENDVPSKK